MSQRRTEKATAKASENQTAGRLQAKVRASTQINFKTTIKQEDEEWELSVYQLQLSFNAEHAMLPGSVSGLFSAACFDAADQSDSEEGGQLVPLTP